MHTPGNAGPPLLLIPGNGCKLNPPDGPSGLCFNWTAMTTGADSERCESSDPKPPSPGRLDETRPERDPVICALRRMP
jgi:hypothetical protein